MSEIPMKLYAKILQVRKSVPYLQKEAENAGQGFKYVSSSQVLGAVRKVSDELGILYIPSVKEGRVVPEYSGGKMTMTQLSIDYTIVDVDSGESITIPWYGQGTDQHEKGVGKALTYAEKYFLLKFYNIPTDRDDPDAWAEDVNKSFDKTSSAAAALKPLVMPDELKRLIVDATTHATSGDQASTEKGLDKIAAYIKANEAKLPKGIITQARQDYRSVQNTLKTVINNKEKAADRGDDFPY